MGKVAIVTGSTSGMGYAIAKRLAREGVQVVLVARTMADLARVAQEIEADGGQAIPVPADVSERVEVEAVVERTLAQYGRIDVVVNSAFWGPSASLGDTTESFWDRTLDTCLKGPYLFARAVFPVMKRQRQGRIINIGSLAGKIGEDNRTAYCAAKWGLEGLTAALQEEMPKYNIHVNLISPGATNTPFWSPYNPSEAAIERMIPPETVAEAVYWILQQPDNVLIQDIPIHNYRNPFEGKSSPFAD